MPRLRTGIALRPLAALCSGMIATAPFHARADIEFIGMLATSHSVRFALGDTSTGRTDWVTRGDEFGGYVVSAYDAEKDTLVLRRDGAEVRIRLKDDAKVKSARLELTGAITMGGAEKMAIERATLQFDQENVFPLKDGITYRITPKQRPDGTLSYAMAIERVLGPNKIERLSAPGVVALPGQPFSVRIDDLEFSFKPR